MLKYCFFSILILLLLSFTSAQTLYTISTFLSSTRIHDCAVSTKTGTIYFTDQSKIQKATTSGGTFSTLVSSDTPDGIDVVFADGVDQVYFTERYKIRKEKNGTVSDVVGKDGQSSYYGDGGLAIDALVKSPVGVYVSKENDYVVVADTGNFVIRKINSTGHIFKLGGSTQGFSGDGGLAVNAQLHTSSGVAVSSNGDILVADRGNHIIRKITKDGYISTIAGKPNTSGYSGDGGLATNALLNDPFRVKISPSGDIFICEFMGHRVRKIDSKTGIITTIAGNGATSPLTNGVLATLSSVETPNGLCFGSGGVIYIASERYLLRKLTPSCVPGSILMENGMCAYQCFGYPSLNSSISACSGNGECTSFNSCNCTENYYGSNCERFKCYNVENNSSEVCSTHGKCIAHNNCSCLEGYHGLNCELYECGISFNNSQVCSGRGNCSSPNQCQCELGYSGNECQQFHCNSILFDNETVCSSSGICISPNNCSCREGFYGNDCDMFDCFGIPRNNSYLVCSSHGVCKSLNNCSCDTGYYGNNCESTTCFGVENNSSQVCNHGNGTCLAFDECKCHDERKWYGANCNLTSCFGKSMKDENVCDSHGDCVSFDTCQCSTNYIGNQCQLRFNSQPMNLTFNSSVDYLGDVSTMLSLQIQDLQFLEHYSNKRVNLQVNFYLNSQLWNQISLTQLLLPIVNFSLPSSLTNGTLTASIILNSNATLISLEYFTPSPLILQHRIPPMISKKITPSQSKGDVKDVALSSTPTGDSNIAVIVVAVVVPVVVLGTLAVVISVAVLVVILMKKKAAAAPLVTSLEMM